MYKNNSRDSSKFNGCSPLQLLYNLTGMKPAIGYYSYTKRWQQAKKNTNEKQNTDFTTDFITCNLL
jgi:hypothetical protein